MTIESKKFSNNVTEILYSDLPHLEKIHRFSQYYDCCEAPDIIENKGLYICKNCAVVHGPVMKNYISYDLMANSIHNEKKFKYPPQYYGCRTVFSLENLSPKNKVLYQRLSKLNRHFHNSYEYNMTSANQFLFKIAGLLEIPPSIKHHAIRIYIKVVNKRLTIGRSIKYLMTASLYIACLLHKCSRRIEEFSKVTQIPIKAIRKNYRLILKELNIKVKNTPASYYLSQYCIKLGLSVKFQSCAHLLLQLISEKGFNGNSSPRSFAAAAIYIISKNFHKEKRIKQKNLSEISKVSEVTIRKYIKIFKNNLDFGSLQV